MENSCEIGDSKTCHECELMLSELYAKYANLKAMFTSLSSCMPDMVWAKDLDGKYTYANNRLAFQLYNTNVINVIGKTDAELATICKKNQGDDAFTFGEVCGNSDEEVLRNQRSMKFLEEGLIKNIHTYLMVHKNVETDNQGNVIGTVGTGRDITWMITSLHKIAEETTDEQTRKDIIHVVNENYFSSKVI